MTSLSPRKRRTTLPNTRLSKFADRPLAIVSAVLISFGCAAAGAADKATEAKSDPLSRLKSRSAESRWGELNTQWDGLNALGTIQKSASAEAVEVKPAPVELPDLGITAELEAADESDVQPVLPEPEVSSEVQFVSRMQRQSQYTRREPLTDPTQLKKVTDILPYFDYEPDPEVRAQDPCQNLCPRPDGAPCADVENAPECPEEIRLSTAIYEGRFIPDSVFNWEASNLYHNPLYFEDAALERYGHSHYDLVQPFVSVGKFSVQLLGIPYQATLDPVHKRQYTLGWYRPGECTPKKCYQIPLNGTAAAVTAGVYTGLFFAIP